MRAAIFACSGSRMRSFVSVGAHCRSSSALVTSPSLQMGPVLWQEVDHMADRGQPRLGQSRRRLGYRRVRRPPVRPVSARRANDHDPPPHTGGSRKVVNRDGEPGQTPGKAPLPIRLAASIFCVPSPTHFLQECIWRHARRWRTRMSLA